MHIDLLLKSQFFFPSSSFASILDYTHTQTSYLFIRHTPKIASYVSVAEFHFEFWELNNKIRELILRVFPPFNKLL